MKQLLLTCTDLMAIQFLVPHVKYLSANGFSVELACSDVGGRMDDLHRALDGVAQIHTVRLARSPFSPGNAAGFGDLKKIIDGAHWDIIWTNEPVMGVMTRLAARKARKHGTKVFYIAHGFHFYKGAPKKNWLLWYPIEKYMCRYTDKLITINEEDFQLAQSKFPVEAYHIHGVGVSTDRYHLHSAEDTEKLRKEEHLSEQDFAVLCTGELNANKDQRTLIEAAVLCRDRIPGLKVLLAGRGPMEAALREQIINNHAEDFIRMLGYRTDLERVVPAADVIVSCSHREGLGLNLIEGMLCGKPVIAVENRGHRELIENCVTGYLVPIGDSRTLAEKLVQIHDDGNQKELGRAGYEKAQKYTSTFVEKELEGIFELGVNREICIHNSTN